MGLFTPANAVNAPSTSASASEPKECSICLDHISSDPKNKGEKEKALKCHHIFHKECIHEWATQLQTKHLKATCPMCRADLEYVEKPAKDQSEPVVSSSGIAVVDTPTPAVLDEASAPVEPETSAPFAPETPVDPEQLAEILSLTRNNIREIRVTRLNLNDNTPVAHTARRVDSIAARLFGFR